MTTIQMQVVKDTARPMLAGLAKRVANPAPGLNIAARAVGNLLKKHFREKAQQPNKLGGERTFFWLAVAQGVNAPVQTSPTSVQVSVTHPAINQKIYGGTITAKRAGALTIPLVAVARGRRASALESFLGIKLFRVKNVLAAVDPNTKKLTAYYALVKSVTQRPDPTALPPAAELQQAADNAFGTWFNSPELAT